MKQSVFELALPPAYREENFHIADCNREAHNWIARFPDWPAQALLIFGPRGSGKTHLAHLWAAKASARTADISTRLSPERMEGNWLIEDVERIHDEVAFLHLINFSRENKAYLLLTSSLPVTQLPFHLPDLTSRLKALPACGIDAPDDTTLGIVLRKQFSDRQLKVEEEVIAFLLPRIERSFTKAADVVERLDRQALAEQRNLTIPFVKRALGY